MSLKLTTMCGVVAAGMLSYGAANAAFITQTGDFVQVSYSSGVLGQGGTLGQGAPTPGGRPALIHDPSGTGTFDTDTDYIAGGVPWEGFAVRATDAAGADGFWANGNSGPSGGPSPIAGGAMMDISGSHAADHAASWSGGVAGIFDISHVFWFNDGDEAIQVETTITALQDLTNVSTSRAVDPDPDNIPGGSAITDNDRGFGATIPVEDFVTSTGTISGRTLGYLTDDPTTHNTGIVFNCCSTVDPLIYLAGGEIPSIPGTDHTADDGLGIAFDIGDLANGDSHTVTFAYVMGESREDIVGVPEPSTLALTGIALLAGVRARKRRTA